MENTATNGGNTGEQRDESAPTGKKHFKPIGPDWVYVQGTPLNYRPPAGEKRDFVVGIIKEKGTQQLGLDHIVMLAMASKGIKIENPVPARTTDPNQAKEITRLQKLLKDMERDLSTTQELLRKAKESKPAPGTNGYLPTGEIVEKLQKVVTKRKLKSIPDALDYCISFTAKNDWL